MSEDLTEAAVHYAELGFFVLPARVVPVLIKGAWKKAKVPQLIHGHNQASNDPSEVERMFLGTHENISPKARGYKPDILGMRHDRFLVIDVDTKHNKPGAENFERLRPNLPEPIATVRTSSGGWHVYYKNPRDPALHERKTDALIDGEKFIGIDILMGRKGWVAVPPSPGYTFTMGSMEHVAESLHN
jgi:hypothetical protein